jgi:adenine-specific DNA-methyltransferase
MKKKSNHTSDRRPIETYEHRDKERINNPPVGLVTPDTDPDAGQKRKRYAYDPHLDPQLVWAGKAEHTSFEVPTVSLHVHERIDPRTIIEAVRKKNGNGQSEQLGLFEEERKEPLREAIEFYQHKHGWSNRLIAGDSLLVMNSLLEKEGMAGKVQMIYIDPPYGIKYGSNFQPFVNKRDVKDGKDEDLTCEPEQIRAFRDTWELGIHSYLTYLRDRLLLAREMLHESGSIFVQISDENVHHVRELMDEVFGAGNFVSLISFSTTSGFQASTLSRAGDYLCWYARDKQKTKYHQLFREKLYGIEGMTGYDYVELADGTERNIAFEEKENPSLIPKGARLFSKGDLQSQGPASEDQTFEHQGRTFRPNPNSHWKPNFPEGLQRLCNAGRVTIAGNTLRYKRYQHDFSIFPINNLWPEQLSEQNKRFVVQTSEGVIQRCLLMTTDPGDLVFDPTCGSGTTAYVAEQWGRRWITCDTSRVALTLARQRLMTAVFDYYELAHPEEGVGSGFKYKTVPHVTLKSIANNPEIDGIYARMHPAVEQALADLNAALKGRAIQFKVRQGGRAEQVVDFAAPDSATFTMPSGQVVKVNELVEWEVPFEFPADWPEEARPAFERFHQARRAMQKAMDEAIALHAPQETLYDQPFVDRKKVRVTGPFTVEAVPAPAVKTVDEILEPRPEPADASIARSGETLRQSEWRDELLKTGIRGKNGQYIRFARLEPLPGCRWLHADGETRPSDEGADTVCEPNAEYTGQRAAPAYESMRVVVSFGPEHAPLEQRQVQRAWEEAQQLVPKPRLLVFAAFQFDPEAARDIDAMKLELAGMQFLKVQMNADLLTDDLKKKRASNESFWLIGQPDVVVDSEQWIVNSRQEALAPYDVVAKLSGARSLAEINGPGRDDLSTLIAIAERRDLWDALAAYEGSGVGSGKHRRGAGATHQGRVSSVPERRAGLPRRIGDAADFVRQLEALDPRARAERIKRLRGSREIADRARQISASLTGELSTIHYSQVTILGFDYYNTKTGSIESGGQDKIAVWLLDTDYDGRSLYPRQVFFPMAGEKEGWARLAKNLKAEIDEDLIEAYRGTVSLPFAPGEHKRIAVKIVDDRGIESLRVMEID